MLEQALQRAWLRRGWLACTLWPLSRLFGAVAALHRTAYRLGWLHATRTAVPVVVVGNVLVGGTGKTPVVLAVVAHLRARGLRPGIVSRGWGRTGADCRAVAPSSHSEDVGDEPLLLAQRSGVPVFVAARRVQAAQALLAAHPDVDVLVSDDGLQHRALARDIEICVFDDRGAGNGWLLPAGPLREPWPRAVDLVLRPPGAPLIAGFDVTRTLAAEAVRADGTRIPLHELAVRPCVALAGIGRPDVFFDMLRARGFTLPATHALPDHYAFDSIPGNLDAGYSLVCTEKDATKLWRHRPHAWAVPLVLAIEPAFWRALDRLLPRRYHRPMDPKLLELLVCPVTKGHLEYDRERQELLSRSARLAYPVRDGIPVLLEDEARVLSDEELEQIPARTPLV